MEKGHIVVPRDLKDKLDGYYLSIPEYRAMSKEEFYSLMVKDWMVKVGDNVKKTVG